MNTLLLEPNDVLFFRDGRPMGGSSVGHGAAWPLPSVTNAAMHAALWRGGLMNESHAHDRKNGRERSNGGERFGSLTTVGPFPVCTKGQSATWFFPRPLDAICTIVEDDKGKQTGEGSVTQVAAPVPLLGNSSSSGPLPYVAASLVPPTKEAADEWWSEGAWAAYLGTDARDTDGARIFTRRDADFSDSEACIGIGIDAESGTQDGTRFYAAHYLRLRDGWKLGLLAATQEKTDVRGERIDLVSRLIQDDRRMLVGGQQRICAVEKVNGAAGLPLPTGRTEGFPCRLADGHKGKQEWLVKWVLLSPAIFPCIEADEKDGKVIRPHRGGWLPNWIEDGGNHHLLLKVPLGPRDVTKESREAYRARVRDAETINARLVAAMVGKPVAVTGWSLGTPDQQSVNAEPRGAGAKPTHLAVPAGSVYYFACATPEDAIALAAALNWHGAGDTTAIRNRRSTLFGEKGFGIGVCGIWDFHVPCQTP